MTDFIRYDPDDGRVLGYGRMDQRFIDEEIAAGAAIAVVDEPITDLGRAYYDLATGRVSYRDPSPPPPPSYQELRAPEYPPLSELADALYWAQKGDTSKLAAWVAACDAVKAAKPKDATG